MNFFDQIAPQFFYEEAGSTVWRLAAGARSHRSNLSKIDEGNLGDAVQNGQKPHYAVYFNGPIPGAMLLGLPSAQAFSASCRFGVLPPPEDDQGVRPVRSTVAAAEYAKYLGVKKHLMIMNSGAFDIADFVGPTQQHGPHGQAWDKVLAPIIRDVRKTHTDLKLNNVYRLAQQELLMRSATNLEKIADIEVVPFFFDAVPKSLTRFDRDPLTHRFKPAETSYPIIPSFPQNFHPPVVCSCCDSRALFCDAFTTQPGEFLESNTIAGIVAPSRDVLASGQPSSIWAMLEASYQAGNRIFITKGHRQCGGIAGLINLCTTGKNPGGYVGSWLQQGHQTGVDVVSYAREDDFFDTDDKVMQLAELRMTEVSAMNIGDYIKEQDSEARPVVLSIHYDIATRIAYPLGHIDPQRSPAESMRRTASFVKAMRSGDFPNLSQVDQERTLRISRHNRRILEKSGPG